MKVNSAVLSVLVAVLLLVVVAKVGAGFWNKKHKVVFDVSVSNPESWKTLLRNITNLKKALGPDSQIRVVAYSKGLDLLLTKDQDLAKNIDQLEVEGVAFAACNNSIKAKGITEKDLLPKSEVIDSGVAELVRLQEDGWSYIKLASYGPEKDQ